MQAMEYEYLLRDAFGIASSVARIEKDEDPAGLANASLFNTRNINLIKIGTGYAMEIIKDNIQQGKYDLLDEQTEQLNSFANRLIECQDLNCISALISEFRNDFLLRYLR